MAKATKDNTKKAAPKKAAVKKVKATVETSDMAGKGGGVQLGTGEPAAGPIEQFEAPALKGEESAEDTEGLPEVDKLDEAMKPYLDAYPDVKKFHISTDGQVFLDDNKRDGEAHQKFIDEKKSLVEYVRK